MRIMRIHSRSCGPQPPTRFSTTPRGSLNGHSIFTPRDFLSEPRCQDTLETKTLTSRMFTYHPCYPDRLIWIQPHQTPTQLIGSVQIVTRMELAKA